MEKQLETAPYFFIIDKKYSIGTPKAIAPSDRTIDIPFEDFAKNYDLQCKLKLASAAFVKPSHGSLPKSQKLVESVAFYLAAFCEDHEEQNRRIDYLINNGLVRILFTDDDLKSRIKGK